MISGNEIGSEVSEEARLFAKENGIVILYGASDDLAILEGAIRDEIGSLYNGGEIAFVNKEVFSKECENDECPHESRIYDSAFKIEAEWSKKKGVSWTYSTNIPHEKFEVKEDGEIFCEGIVFFKKDLP